MLLSSNWDGILVELWKFWLLLGVVIAVVIVTTIVLNILQRVKFNKFGCCNNNCDNCVLPKGSTAPKFSTRDMVFGALAVSLSFVLSFLRVFSLPFGGSITLASALPMLLYSYFFGFKKSLPVCMCYMFLSLLYQPFIVSPWSALLDYVLPSFAMTSTGVLAFKLQNIADKLTGFAKHAKFYLGVAVYFAIRMSSHTIAGVLFWSQGVDWSIWQGDLVGLQAFWYSLTYNLAYLLPDTLLAVLAAALVLKSDHFVKSLMPK